MIRPISRTRTAFTLVELLVVIAIIGTLVALLIPAVQMARESGRRALCNSNLHQIAIAVAQHDEAFGTIPPGLPNCVDRSKFGIAGGVDAGAWCQGPNWAIAILPYMEEQSQFANIKSCMEVVHNVCDECSQPQGATPAPLATLPAPFICPSAEFIESSFYFKNATTVFLPNQTTNPGASIPKGNYAANFGSNNYLSYQDVTTAGAFDIVDVRGARGSQVVQMKNDPSMLGGWKMGSKLGVKLAAITDGATQTILVSEVLGYSGAGDNRGAWSFSGMGASSFTTKNPPNSPFSDTIPSCEPFVMPPPSGPTTQFNCTVDPNLSTMPGVGTFAASRSSHPGGVNTVMVDGSTHFFTDDISQPLWQNLGTRRGGTPAELPPE